MSISKTKQLSYLLRYSILSRISRKGKKPIICSFKLTNRCNLKCRHCPFWRDEKKMELGYEDVKKTLEYLYENGVRIVIFEGGEPLIYRDKARSKTIADVIKLAKEMFFFVGVTTNGTIPLYMANPDITFISLDGLEKTHDYIRGKSFSKIMQNIENHNRSRRIIVNICISKINYGEIERLIKFLEDKVYGVTIQFFYPYPDIKDLYLDDRKRVEVLEMLMELKRKGLSILDSFSCLEAFKDNSWKCRDFLVSSIDPDGSIKHGCYLKKRIKDISCKYCGFAVHCEISLAYSFDLGAIRAARHIFWDK